MRNLFQPTPKRICFILCCLAFVSCDSLPGNDKDKWRFHQEIHVQGGTTGGATSPIGSSDYQIHDNSYYGGGSSSGVSDYRSNYKPYEPYQGYEVGSATQYYRGDGDE